MENKKKIIIIAVVSIAVILAIILGIVIFNNSKSNNKDEQKDIFELLYKDGEKYYYADEKGKIYTFEGYNKIGEFNNNLAVVSKTINGKREYAIINKNEKEIVKYGEYSEIDELNDGEYYRVEKDSKYGIINSNGKVILPLQYDSVKAYEDINIFEVKKDDKYYYIAENGKEICETEKTSYFNTITFYKRINDKYDYLVKINNNYYNAKTGDLIISNKESIKFEYNILFEDKKISIYDKNLKLKEELNDGEIVNLEINKTDLDYIILTETIKKDNNNTYKYRIYDENLKLKKEVECADAKTVTFQKIEEEHFCIKEDLKAEGKDNKYKVTLYNKDLKEYTRESSRAIYAFVNSNKEITFIECDFKDYIVYLYNAKGDEIAKIENHKVETAYICGDYIALTNTKNRNYDIYKPNGELVAEGARNKDVFENGIIKLNRTNNESSVIVEDGIEIKNNNYNWEICGESIVAYSSSEKKVKVYDEKGKQTKEISDVNQMTVCGDKYLLLKNDNKYNVFNTKNNKNVFEFDISALKNQYSKKGLEIIELEDAFYNFEGKKLIEKKK